MEGDTLDTFFNPQLPASTTAVDPAPEPAQTLRGQQSLDDFFRNDDPRAPTLGDIQQHLTQQRQQQQQVQDTQRYAMNQLHRPWEEVAPELAQRLPRGMNAGTMESAFRMEQARRQVRDLPDSRLERLTSSGIIPPPVFGLPSDYYHRREYSAALQRIQQGQALNGRVPEEGGPGEPNDYETVARYEEAARRQGEEGTFAKMLREAGKAPALITEGIAAGPFLGRIGGLGARLAVGAGARAGGLAARGAGALASAAATPAVVPSAGFYGGMIQGQNPATAYGTSALNMAVLNSVGRLVPHVTTGGRLGLTLAPEAVQGGLVRNLGNLAGGVGAGLLEQQAADALVSATIDRDAGYGVLGHVYRGEHGQALQQAAVQSVMFGIFAGKHEMPSLFANASSALRRRGLSANAAGQQFSDLTTNILANRNYGQDLRGPVGEYARALGEATRRMAPETQPQSPPPQQPPEVVHHPPFGPEPGIERSSPPSRRMGPEAAQDVFRDVLSPEGVQEPEQRPAAPRSEPEAQEGQRDLFARPAEESPSLAARSPGGESEAQTRAARRPSGDALDILERATQQARQARIRRAQAEPDIAPEQQAPEERPAPQDWRERVFGYRAQSFRQQIEQLARNPSAEGPGRAEEMVGALRGMAERLGRDPTDEVGQHLRGAVEDLIASHNEAPVSHEQAASEAAAAERDLHEHAARLERLGQSVGLDKASVRRGIGGTLQEADQAFAAAAPPAEAQGQRPNEPAPAPAVREAAGGELGHAERLAALNDQARRPDFSFDALGDARDALRADPQMTVAKLGELAKGLGLRAIRGLKREAIIDRIHNAIGNRAQRALHEGQIGQQLPKAESMLTAAQRRGGIDFKSVQTMYGPEEAKRIAAQNPGIFKGGGRPLDSLAEEMQRAGELRVPEHLNPADALVQAILEKKPHGNQDFEKVAEAQHEAYQRRQQEEEAQQTRETPGEANEEGSSGPGQVNPEFGFRREPQPGEHKFGSPLTPEEAQGGIPGGGQENATQGAARHPMKESALANAHIDEQRQKRGEQPILSQARMSNPEVWDRAMERIDNDPGLPDRLVNELLEKPRATTVEENAILLRHLVANRNEHSRAIMELLRAIRPDVRRSMDSATFNAIDAREKEAERAVTRVEQAARVSGSEWGRAGQFRRQLAAEDYSLSGMIRSAEVAAKRPLSDIERQQIADMHAKITDLQSRLDAALSGAKPPADPGKPGDMADLRIGARKAQQVFDNHLRSLRASAAPLPQRILSGTREVMDFIRALITSADLSAVFRQGGFLTFSRPVQAAKAFPEMIRGLLSERQFERAQDALAQRPNAARYRQAGLYLADTAGPPNAAEEAFAGRVSKATATLRKYLGINAAERAYTGFLNRVRADTFDAMSATLGRNGFPSIQESRQLAHFINVATGRGQLGESGEKAAALLSNVFFSPRYVASRFQLLAGQPLIQGTPATRRLIALEYGRMLAGIGVFYGLVRLFFPDSKIEGDPRSSDFGKVHIGNTRIDPLMGLSQNAVFVSRLLAGQTRSSTTGRVSDLRGARVPYGGSTVPDVITRYVRSKLAPIPGLAVDVAAGRDVVGQPVTARRLASDVTVPLALRDSYGAMQDLGIPKGTAASLLGVLGMGVQTYQRR